MSVLFSHLILPSRVALSLLKRSNVSVPTLYYCSKSSKIPYIDDLVKANKVVVFMKGTPDRPLCGFSNAIIQVMKFHGVENFDAHDVLANEQLRQDIKEYSNWPTIPQVYINEEFVGGCDVILDMHKNGELIEELKKVGIRSRLLEEETSKQK